MGKRNSLIELTWDDVREQVKQVNPKLAAVIDLISPDSRHKLFKASYAFGEEILKDGLLQIPNENGKLVPLSAAPNHIQNALSYNFYSNPVSMVLSGSSEIFIISDNHTIPLYSLIPPGKIFGLWTVLSSDRTITPAFIWDMTSGARSLFMLPKISKMKSHRRIAKELGLQREAPKNIVEHWHVFKEVANHVDFGMHWSSEFLFFTKEWFEGPILKDFKLHLLETVWDDTSYWRNQFFFNLAFSLIQKERNMKASAYTINIVRHLLSMGIGALSGYAPAIDDSAGPVKQLQEMYSSIYNLPYAPSIMQPYSFSLESDRSIYFSFAFPSIMDFSGKSREDSSKLDDLLTTHSYLKKYLSGLENNNLHIEQTPYARLTKQVQFDFYHTDFSRFTSLKDPVKIAIEDKYFNIPEDKIDLFPSKSAFLRGCVRISRNTKPIIHE